WERGVFPTFLDSQSLVGWRTFHLGVHQSNQNGGTVMDYGAQEIPAGFATVGALRRYAKQHGGGA
ncbi:MAG: hypothetical protein ACXWCQ_33735, partial [Burkholderiales bacterium]